MLTKDLPAETLSALLDALVAVNGAGALEETFGAIARSAAAVMRAEASSVILADRARNRQVFVAAVGDRADQLMHLEYEMGAGLSGKAMAARHPLVVDDVAHDKAHYSEIDHTIAFHTRSLIAAPLVHNGEVLGVVEVINPIDADHFTRREVQLAEIFANLAAVAFANARRLDRVSRENAGLRQAMGGRGRMIGDSPAMRQVFELIDRVAGANASVLLLGESGVGKELAAWMIHDASPRAQRAFIPVNCAALPETLLESELFGHEAGAFTGATARRLGRFELADGGTIFLDEIGEVSPAVQVKLLRVLQEREFVRVGGTRTVGCDVRVIAATNRNLEGLKNEGRFREDLYYRLNVFPITIPPLRQRPEDIPALVEHFLSVLSEELKIDRPELTAEAAGALAGYHYPGNIRELRNILERACLLADGGVIQPGHLSLERPLGEEAPPPADDGPQPSSLAAAEKVLIIRALRASGWNQSRAARSLGISRDNLRYRVKKYGIEIPR